MTYIKHDNASLLATYFFSLGPFHFSSQFVLFNLLNAPLYSIIDFVFSLSQILVEKKIGVDMLFAVFQH